jgi:hypothetical protein
MLILLLLPGSFLALSSEDYTHMIVSRKQMNFSDPRSMDLAKAEDVPQTSWDA